MKVKKTSKMLNECPNCCAIWGIGSEEWDWQQCDSCGWPNNADDDDDFDDDDNMDWPEDDYDQLSEDNNPNDSRNI